MAKPTIFRSHTALRPSTMATVAERRLDDAQALSDTGRNAHANGVAYLAGFVIEILLKARLVANFPATEVLDAERKIWSLIWKSHDLEGMLEMMPELEAALEKQAERSGVDYLRHLKSICAAWTIQARYSPATIRMTEARALLDQVREVKEVLK
jgi:glutathionylspermidine synthase